MSEKGYMPSLSQIRNAYTFLYGVDEEDPGRALEEAGEDFDRWLDAHTESAIRRATTPKYQLDLEEVLEDCLSCWGTRVIDSAEHRCGTCAGRGYLKVYRKEGSYELADHVEAMKQYLKENELPDMTRRAFIADLHDVLREVGEDV